MKNIGKTIRRAMAGFLCIAALAGCAGGENTEDTANDTASGETAAETEAMNGLVLLSDGISNFKVVRGETAEDYQRSAAVSVRKTLNTIFGFEVPIQTDWVKERGAVVSNDDFEILVGDTNRTETIQVTEQLPKYGYAVQIVNNKIVIVARNENGLNKAVSEFIELLEQKAGGNITITDDDCFIREGDPPTQLSDLIGSSINYTVKLVEAVRCPAIGEYCVAQGAASDGTYVYFLLRTAADGDAIICKYTLDTGEYVAQSEPVYVFHGNDMTYDKAKNLLYISHGSTEGKILTSMDPDTMTVVDKKITIAAGSGAITYSVATDRFAISQGGSTLHIFDGELKLITSYSRRTGLGYTAQGMGSDEKYVYFPMSGSEDNIFEVYDWNGNYADTVHIPTKWESETMFWVNDTYYINFNRSKTGAHLYRLEFILE